MALVNQYILDVDLKYRYTAKIPKFRRGDNGVLLFRIYNDGKELDLSVADKAEIFQITPSGKKINELCEIVEIEGRYLVKYQYSKSVMREIGLRSISIRVHQGNINISIIPMTVLIYDDLQGGSGSYLELVKDLESVIVNSDYNINNTVLKREKGIPDGVASTDGGGKIPLTQLPLPVENHLNDKFFKHNVHGFFIDEHGFAMYETREGNLQNIGFADNDGTSGCAVEDLFVIPEVNILNGIVRIKYNGNPSVISKKYDVGERDESYFEDNGIVIDGETFILNEVGLYTLWYKDSNNKVYTYLFYVSTDMLPIIDKPVIMKAGGYRIGNTDSYRMILSVVDSNYKIIKAKNIDDNGYNPINPIDVNIIAKDLDMGDVDISDTNNRYKEFVCGFENEIGERVEVTFYMDNDYLYYWIDSTDTILNKPLHDSNVLLSPTVQIPSIVNSRSVTILGNKNEPIFNNNASIITLNIPISINRIYPLLLEAESLIRVSVGNENMIYEKNDNGDYPFKLTNKTVEMISHINSTTEIFVQERSTDDDYKLSFTAL